MSQLDIKSSKVSHHPVAAVEDDLLADLEPTIAKGSGLLDLLEEKVKKSYAASAPPVSKFTVDDDSHEEELEGGGWGDDDGGWGNNDLKLNKND